MSQRLSDLHEKASSLAYHLEWKNKLFKKELEPNDENDEEIRPPDDGYELLRIKSNLKKKFQVLDDDNFDSFIKSTHFTIVFFYLPCK